MSDDRDHYEVYYADKLWNLLPAVYRTEDTDVFDKPGPLRELVNRIGAQVAIVRRSIDRLWEDQSIETCDDWVIPYIADLLATRLVASLDARGQRLDVAKTIYYRRRAGTIAILEEIATAITDWEARVVEFSRRLARTRHGLDPAIGLPSATEDPDGNRDLQLAQGLIGAYTNTASGGWADLRKVYGATKAHSAFDEFFHTADLRRGRGQVGWYNIPHLGVFLWRLQSFEVAQTTPVAGVNNYLGQYSFDPTGRCIPLFAAKPPTSEDNWVPREEWQLPTRISKPLLAAWLKQLYAVQPDPAHDTIQPNSLGVFDSQGHLIPVEQIMADPRDLTDDEKKAIRFLINPERGLLVRCKNEDAGFVTYHYGFSSTIGAGPYDRRILGEKPAPTSDYVITGGGGGKPVVDQNNPPLKQALNGVASGGTVTIQDSLTYDQIIDVNVVSVTAGIQKVVTLRAGNKSRPLIRLPESVLEWVFTGAPGSELVGC
jgi:hypothetical protein